MKSFGTEHYSIRPQIFHVFKVSINIVGVKFPLIMAFQSVLLDHAGMLSAIGNRQLLLAPCSRRTVEALHLRLVPSRT
jgi:hypothetical protein